MLKNNETPDYCKDCTYVDADDLDDAGNSIYNGKCGSWLVAPDTDQCVNITLARLAGCKLLGFKLYDTD